MRRYVRHMITLDFGDIPRVMEDGTEGTWPVEAWIHLATDDVPHEAMIAAGFEPAEDKTDEWLAAHRATQVNELTMDNRTALERLEIWEHVKGPRAVP